jgi:hypothetical protein
VTLRLGSVKTARVVNFRVQIFAGAPAKMLPLRFGNMANAAGPLIFSVPLILGIFIPRVCGRHLKDVVRCVVIDE